MSVDAAAECIKSIQESDIESEWGRRRACSRVFKSKPYPAGQSQRLPLVSCLHHVMSQTVTIETRSEP